MGDLLGWIGGALLALFTVGMVVTAVIDGISTDRKK